MIEIKTVEDLVKFSGSIIRVIEMRNDPVRLILGIDGPDEQRYTLTVTPNYTTQATPLSLTITTGINLNVSQDKE